MRRRIRQRLLQEWRVWQVGALPGLAVIGLVILLRWLGALQFLELVMLDAFLRSRPAEPIDERVLIVGIDDDDIRNLADYPISSAEIIQVLQTIQSYEPSVIGLDLFRGNDSPLQQQELAQAFQKNRHWITIDRPQLIAADHAIPPPTNLAPEQVGFANAILDPDGFIRRSLLSAFDLQNQHHFSFTAQLASHYLQRHGYELDSGNRDPAAFRFGQTEFDRFHAQDGGYVNADDGENQVLINFRSGYPPFRKVSWADLQNRRVPDEWIRNRLVLVGITADSHKDLVNSSVIARDNPSLVYGVELQAHAVSQIINAVLAGRSLLQTLPEVWEYLWIVAWGMLGLGLGRLSQSPLRILLGLGMTSGVLIAVCYGAMILGWWIPVLPAFMALFLNGAGLTTALFYRYEQDLQMRIRERQLVINQTFDAIHSHPLQTLSRLLRTVQEQDLSTNTLLSELRRLDEELRSVWEAVRRETLLDNSQFYLGGDATLDLTAPLHEALYEVFHVTLKRDFPHFKTLKIHIPDLEPLDERFLSAAQKQMLCRFVEEAMCNVGKYAEGATFLRVVCRQGEGSNVIRVMDDGKGMATDRGMTARSQGGTQQAKELARQLGGTFQRYRNSPSGTICELRWVAKSSWLYQMMPMWR